MSNQAYRAYLTILFALSLLTIQAVWAETRTALVIGNGNYQNTTVLPNPPNDAQAVAAALRRLGFKVLEGKDLNRSGMEDLVDEFGKQAESADIAVVFYAGHGIQVDGRNYLMPVEARLDGERDLRRLISLETMVYEAGRAKRLGLVMLDSCRDNPLANTLARGLGLTRSAAVGRGLARVEQTPSDTLVVFATRENSVAADGNERNSPFTTALLQYLEEPGLEVRLLFGKVRDSVLAKTNQRQQPYIYGSLGGTPTYLAPPAATVATPPPATVAPPVAAVVPSPFKPSAPALKPGQVFWDTLSDGTQGPKMVVIPAGEFRMGSPKSEAERYEDERQHKVSVEAFALARNEVTVGEFRRFVEAKGHKTEAETGEGCYTWTGEKWEQDASRNWRNPGFTQGENYPVTCVSWNDAMAYVKWLAGETGQPYRLPTEAEWEYAARAGTETARYWGNDADQGCQYANAADLTSKDQFNWSPVANCRDGYVYTAPVGSFEANRYGLYDMLGNVWEWTCSGYDEGYGGGEKSCVSNNHASAQRVNRGGAWYARPRSVRAAFRNRYAPADRDYYLGFRPARNVTL